MPFVPFLCHRETNPIHIEALSASNATQWYCHKDWVRMRARNQLVVFHTHTYKHTSIHSLTVTQDALK